MKTHEWIKANADSPRVADALRAVLNLHHDWHGICQGCGGDSRWPCNTVTVIKDALGIRGS